MTRKLQNLNDLFEEYKDKTYKNEYISLNIENLLPFRNNHFKLYTGERLKDMEESIKEFGVIEPLIVRPLDNINYEIISGHNRWNAAKKCGLKIVPAMNIKNLSDEEAMLLAVETNLIQRSFTDLSHIEKAMVISEYYRVLKENQRKSNFCMNVRELIGVSELLPQEKVSPLGTSYRKTAEEYQLSKSSVARYIRINELSEPVKEMINSDEIGLRVGVELSYISKELQEYLVAQLKKFSYKLDIKTAELLHEFETKGLLNRNKIDDIITVKDTKKSAVNKGIKIKSNTLVKYFDSKQSAKFIEETILKALEQYFRSL